MIIKGRSSRRKGAKAEKQKFSFLTSFFPIFDFWKVSEKPVKTCGKIFFEKKKRKEKIIFCFAFEREKVFNKLFHLKKQEKRQKTMERITFPQVASFYKATGKRRMKERTKRKQNNF